MKIKKVLFTIISLFPTATFACVVYPGEKIISPLLIWLIIIIALSSLVSLLIILSFLLLYKKYRDDKKLLRYLAYSVFVFFISLFTIVFIYGSGMRMCTSAIF
jgi:hypothetical protein